MQRRAGVSSREHTATTSAAWCFAYLVSGKPVRRGHASLSVRARDPCHEKEWWDRPPYKSYNARRLVVDQLAARARLSVICKKGNGSIGFMPKSAVGPPCMHVSANRDGLLLQILQLPADEKVDLKRTDVGIIDNGTVGRQWMFRFSAEPRSVDLTDMDVTLYGISNVGLLYCGCSRLCYG